MKKLLFPLAIVICTLPYQGNTQALFKENPLLHIINRDLRANEDPTEMRDQINSKWTKAGTRNNYELWLNEMDSLGEIHNDALGYSFQRLRTMQPALINASTAPEIVATLTAEYFTNRYGAIYNFTEEQLKTEILKNGTQVVPIESLPVSDQLKSVFTEISRCLTNLSENETSEDLKAKVAHIANNANSYLDEKEKLYLKAYEQGITKSFEYWDQNANAWAGLANSPKISKIKPSTSGKATLNRIDLITPKQRHPCTGPVVTADVSGVIRGAIAGCITGAIFGAVVGCIPAAIFTGALNGASGSLAAALACLIIQTQN